MKRDGEAVGAESRARIAQPDMWTRLWMGPAGLWIGTPSSAGGDLDIDGGADLRVQPDPDLV